MRRRKKKDKRRHAPIDYANAKEFPKAAARTVERRGEGKQLHDWMIGHWTWTDGYIVLEGIKQPPGYANVAEALEATITIKHFATWRTRQGAHNWLNERPGLKAVGWHPINLWELVKLQQERKADHGRRIARESVNGVEGRVVPRTERSGDPPESSGDAARQDSRGAVERAEGAA